MRPLLIPVLAVALLMASCTRQPVDEPAAVPPGTIDLRDESGALAAYDLRPADIVGIVERANAFHEGIWPARPARFGHRVHLMKQWSPAADDLAAAAAGCVTVLALENIQQLAKRHRRPLVEAVELAVAHELAHCFQRAAIPNHHERLFSKQSVWLLEGSASWLAYKFVRSKHVDTPSYFEEEFTARHNQHLLTLSSEALVFFSFLETTWGLDGTSGVMAFLTDPGMPAPTCHAAIAAGPFPEAHAVPSGGNCPGEASPYRAFLEAYLKRKELSLKELMSAYATILSRGEIRGAPSIEGIVHEVEIMAKPAPVATTEPTPLPLVNGWLMALVTQWMRDFEPIPIAEWRLIPEGERLDPLAVRLVRFSVDDVDVTPRFGGIWHGIEPLGEHATVDVTQTALNGEPGAGLSWQFHPMGGVIIDREVRPYAEATAPSLSLQDLTRETGDFTFAITRTAVDDENSSARIRFFAVCPAWTECEVGD